jgi:hypothetical protein
MLKWFRKKEDSTGPPVETPRRSVESASPTEKEGEWPFAALPEISPGTTDNFASGAREESARLRRVLAECTAPVDRHFAFLALGQHLYKIRNIDPLALAEFDDNCERHHKEIDRICRDLKRDFAHMGGLPSLWMYDQAAIRFMKSGDLRLSADWAERGAAVMRKWDPSQVEWLENRRDTALRRLEKPAKKPNPTAPTTKRPAQQRERRGLELSLGRCPQCGTLYPVGVEPGSDHCQACSV